MSIKDFHSKVSNENGALFQALRQLNNMKNPSKLFDVSSEIWAWDAWPTLEAQAPACS